MSSNPTRRSFMAASLVASAALPVIDVFAIDDPERLRLIQRREYLQSEIAKLDRQWALAYAKLPSWCRPGPKFRDKNGGFFGPIVGWPDAGTGAITLDSRASLQRPSARDIFELRDVEYSHIPAEIADQRCRGRVWQLLLRMREARRICHEVGLPRTADWLTLEIELEALKPDQIANPTERA